VNEVTRYMENAIELSIGNHNDKDVK